jgi:serine/threonine protein kinase
MSPEFFNSGDDMISSFEIDIYAFGVTIYFILTGGHYPFEFDIKSISTFAPTPTPTFKTTQNHIKHIPDIVYQCLETDPSSRPSLSAIIDYFT